MMAPCGLEIEASADTDAVTVRAKRSVNISCRSDGAGHGVEPLDEVLKR